MLGRFYTLLAVGLTGLLLLGTSLHPGRTHASKATRPQLGFVAASILPVMTKVVDDGKEKCASCHEDEVAAFNNSTHSRTMDQATLPCQNCHGDATKHLADGGGKDNIKSFASMSPSEASNVCLNCHEKTGKQSQMRRSEHMLNGVACITCHDPHPSGADKMQRVTHGSSAMMRAEQKILCTSCHKNINAQFSLPSHHRLKEGVLNCTNCHNPHGTTEQKHLMADTKETCVKCHEDKRGPFAFEHNASNLNGCLGCHQPHGTTGPHLLKARDVRTLCLSCHSQSGAAGVPHSRLSLLATGDCSRCHSEIHGSHSDPFFTH